MNQVHVCAHKPTKDVRMHKPTKSAYMTGVEGHLNFHAYFQIGISPSCRWVPGFRAIFQVFNSSPVSATLRILLDSSVGALVCSCWPSAENCCSWLLRGVTLSPLTTKSQITNWAQLNTAQSVREGAPGQLMCLSSLGAFWKFRTFTFHPRAKKQKHQPCTFHTGRTNNLYQWLYLGNKIYIHIMKTIFNRNVHVL